MISTSHRFLFIHVPKTGGNSVQGVLHKYADDAIVRIAPHHDGIERFEVRGRPGTVKHSPLGDYHRAWGSLDGYFKFCCVRNPWDMCVSYYFSPHRGEVAWDRGAFIHFVEGTIAPLSRYIGDLSRMDFVMRFENLGDDFRSVCRKVGIPEEPLQRRNVAAGQKSFKHYYDAETVELVASKFQCEIEAFGYSFD